MSKDEMCPACETPTCWCWYCGALCWQACPQDEECCRDGWPRPRVSGARTNAFASEVAGPSPDVTGAVLHHGSTPQGAIGAGPGHDRWTPGPLTRQGQARTAGAMPCSGDGGERPAFSLWSPAAAPYGFVTVGDERAWAVTSPDDRYRYVLGRMWDAYFNHGQEWWERDPARPLWVFCMLNPSTARVDDDHTIRKCIGFAKRGGAGGIMVVNLMAYSETSPKALVQLARSGVDVRGPQNAAALRWAFSRPMLLGRNIAAWGRVPPKLRSVAKGSVGELNVHGYECFGRNEDGSPKHPLTLAYDTPIVPFAGASMTAPYVEGLRRGDER